LVLDDVVGALTNRTSVPARRAGHPARPLWQDLAQIKARYGDRAHTVINNHRATLVLSGVKDPATLDHISRLVGDTEIDRHSTTTDATGRRSTTEGIQYRRLAPDQALRSMPEGDRLLVYGALPPARLQLRPWFRDHALTQVRSSRRDHLTSVTPAGGAGPGRARSVVGCG
jgi:type IV secretory pathway TraG/TraD family ATPase VirD4